MNNLITLNDLLDYEEPERTLTYSPITHREIHNEILSNAEDNGFSIKNINVKARNPLSCIVNYELTDTLNLNPDPEMGIQIGFKNSYNRTVSFGFAIGSVVFLCTNGMVSGEYTIKKQHRKQDVAQSVKAMIGDYFGEIRLSHESNVKMAKQLKAEKLSEHDIHKLIGRLFINNKVMTNAQLRKMSDECYGSKLFNNLTDNYEISAWDLYNHGTEALKLSATTNYFAKHVEYNELFKEEFGIR